MTVFFQSDYQPFVKRHTLLEQIQQEQIKQKLRQWIEAALQSAMVLPPRSRLKTIRESLLAIQIDCIVMKKTFIVVEERITCNQHGLGGLSSDSATLFRGPKEDASVAICVTDRGSLLHRSGAHWKIYRNAGDVHPVVYLCPPECIPS